MFPHFLWIYFFSPGNVKKLKVYQQTLCHTNTMCVCHLTWPTTCPQRMQKLNIPKPRISMLTANSKQRWWTICLFIWSPKLQKALMSLRSQHGIPSPLVQGSLNAKQLISQGETASCRTSVLSLWVRCLQHHMHDHWWAISQWQNPYFVFHNEF